MCSEILKSSVVQFSEVVTCYIKYWCAFDLCRVQCNIINCVVKKVKYSVVYLSLV